MLKKKQPSPSKFSHQIKYVDIKNDKFLRGKVAQPMTFSLFFQSYGSKNKLLSENKNYHEFSV
jgi:hypothetical protein